MPKNQPSEAMEAENAAYVWAKNCLSEHAVEVAKCRDGLSDRQFDEIVWTFERLRIAYERHKALENARLGNNKCAS